MCWLLKLANFDNKHVSISHLTWHATNTPPNISSYNLKPFIVNTISKLDQPIVYSLEVN